MPYVRPRALFRSPLWCGALLVLVVNDHLLKGAGVLPPWMTGKLSDFAGLIVAPALLAWILAARSRRAWLGAHLAVGVGFALLEWSPAARAVESATAAMGWPWSLTCDATDLFALASLFVSWRLAKRETPAKLERPRVASIPRPVRPIDCVLGGVGLLASIATSAKAPEPETPKSPLETRVEAFQNGWVRGVDELREVRSWVHGGELFLAQPIIVDLETGKERSLRLEEREGLQSGPPIAVARGVYLYGVIDGSEGEYVAFDAKSGEALWDEDAEAYEPPVAVGGDTFVFVEQAEIVARAARDGDEKWSVKSPVAVLRIVADEALVYVLDAGDDVTVYDGATGDVRETLKALGHALTFDPKRQSLAATRGMVAISGRDGVQVADASGERRWSQSSVDDSWSVERPKTDSPNTDAPSLPPTMDVYATNGVVIVWRRNATLHAFDAQTGETLWGRDASLVHQVHVDRGRVAIHESRLAIVDARSGAVTGLANLSGRGSFERVQPGVAVPVR